MSRPVSTDASGRRVVGEEDGGATGVGVKTYHVGDYYYPCPMSSYLDGGAFTLDRAHFVPLFLAAEVTIDRLATVVQAGGAAGAGGKFRMGIYTAGDDGWPEELVLDAGVVAVDSAGDKPSGAIEETLTAEQRWLCGVPQVAGNAVIYRTIPHWQAGEALLASQKAGAAPAFGCLYADGVAGALPEEAPAIDGRTNVAPAMQFRVA